MKARKAYVGRYELAAGNKPIKRFGRNYHYRGGSHQKSRAQRLARYERSKGNYAIVVKRSVKGFETIPRIKFRNIWAVYVSAG